MRRHLAIAAAGLTVAASLAGAAGAQEAESRLVLRAVDARDRESSTVAVSYGGDGGALDDVRISIGGDEVEPDPVELSEAQLSNDIVFVIDASEATNDNGLLAAARDAVVDFAEDLPDDTRVAVVSGTAVGATHQRLTSDAAAVEGALDEFSASGQGGLLDAVTLGVGLLGRGSLGSIVLITDGQPDETIAIDTVRGDLLEAGAVFHAVGLEEDGFDEGPLETLASATDGTVDVVDSAADIGDAVARRAPELLQVRALRFSLADETRGVVDLSVALDGARVDGSFVAGGNLVGPSRLEPRPGVEPSGPSFLRGDGGRYLAFGGVAVAALLFAFGLGMLLVRDDTGLNATLKQYAEGYVANDDTFGDDDGAMAQTALLRRAVEATESFAERQGVLTKVEATLERADIPLRAGEAMFFYLAAVLLVAVLALVVTANPVGALVVTGLVALAGPAVLNIRASQKKKKFEGLLPDTLQLLSSTLRAGYSMMQGVEAVSQEAEEPMGKELRRVVTEARLGRPLEESLEGVAERMDSADFGWAVMAIRIQREVGGNLSELLLTVAETMTERERLRRDVRSLTAEGRISAYVLGLLPIGLGAAIFGINPDYMGKLFDETVGQIMLGVAILAMAIGFAWMSKIIKIDI